MFHAALLGLMEDTAREIVSLVADLDQTEYFASRLTRQGTRRRLQTLVRSADDLGAEARDQLAEIDWGAWFALGRSLSSPAGDHDSEWYALQSMVPALLMSLVIYRKSRPEFFRYTP